MSAASVADGAIQTVRLDEYETENDRILGCVR
jgi:hypothetical protein